ncbi:hypothetical protein FOL47_010212, partial [Perkinsus chesapeaki]
MLYHSHQAEWLGSLNAKCRCVCGIPILPIRCRRSVSSGIPVVEEVWDKQEPNYLDIVDEALKAFRLDILALGTYTSPMANAVVDGAVREGRHLGSFRPMDTYDRVMTYIMIWIHRCLCIAEEAMNEPGEAPGETSDGSLEDASDSKLSKDKLLWILKDASIDADKDGDSINDWKHTFLLLREESDITRVSSDDLEQLGTYFRHLRNVTVDRLVRNHLYKDHQSSPSKWWLQYARLVTV